jgi:hypothetical protein
LPPIYLALNIALFTELFKPFFIPESHAEQRTRQHSRGPLNPVSLTTLGHKTRNIIRKRDYYFPSDYNANHLTKNLSVGLPNRWRPKYNIAAQFNRPGKRAGYLYSSLPFFSGLKF